MLNLPFPVRDAHTGGGAGELGDLPEWDLTDLYTSDTAPELEQDLTWLEGECAAFASDYEGKLADLDAAGLLTCVQRNEKINAVAGRIMSFAGLRYYQLTTDADRAKFLSDMQEKVTIFTTPLVFFTLELNRIDDAVLQSHFSANADLARYEPVFRRIRAMKPYQLSDELEKFLHDLGVVGDAWEKLFDETIAGLTFTVDGEELNIEGTLNLLTEQDRSKREAASPRTGPRVSGQHQDLRPRPQHAGQGKGNCRSLARHAHAANRSSPVRTMWNPKLSRRCARPLLPPIPSSAIAITSSSASGLGLEKMQVWDRNAPLPMEDTRVVTWDDAEKVVMDAYSAFDPRMGEIAAPFFSKGWIDAGVKPGKAPGAFAHPTVHRRASLRYAQLSGQTAGM